MNVVCPRCETTFAFSDELYRPERKVRCSVCRNVFPLPVREEETALAVSPQPPAPAKKFALFSRLRLPGITFSSAGRGKKLLVMAAAAVCLVFIGFAGYMAYRAMTAPGNGSATSETGRELTPEEQAALLRQTERVKRIRLADVRQYLVKNEALRRDIMVIEGMAINEFDTVKEFIVIEAALYDGKGTPLASRMQIAGPRLSIIQLQKLDETDFEKVLNDKVAILTTNTDIAPGKSVPFVIIFTRVPQGVEEFEVRPVDARDPGETASAVSVTAPSPTTP